MSIEFKDTSFVYIPVPDAHVAGLATSKQQTDELFDVLVDGYEIVSAVGTQTHVHYILAKRAPHPNALPLMPTDGSDKPS